MARFCRIFVCSAAPSPLAFRIRSSFGSLELGERGDAQILVEPQRLVRTEPGYAQELQHADRDFLPEFLKARMRAIPVKLGDDVGNGVSDPGDLGQPVLFYQVIEGLRERRQAVRGT
jgi:hypothetical protein